jgi:hypothetical protein
MEFLLLLLLLLYIFSLLILSTVGRTPWMVDLAVATPLHKQCSTNIEEGQVSMI